MIEKITDWKGNEIKAGMTIYFVQTEPSFLESSRMGMTIPGTGETFWEDEKNVEERKNQEVWRLGQPYTVTGKDENLFYTTEEDEEGYTASFPISMAFLFGGKPTIAIKGVSDKKE